MNVLLVCVQRWMDGTGLRYLHQYLLANGHHSTLLYLPELCSDGVASFEAIDAFVHSVAPGLIGVSLTSNEYPEACLVTTHLRDAFPGVPVLWGGIHPTVSPETCMDYVDYVCIGEGEQSLLDAVSAVETGKSLRGVRNLAFMEDGKLVRNPLHPLIVDLDSLPLLSHVSPESFVMSKGRIASIGHAALRRYMRYGMAICNVLASRGCPYGCTYCCNSALRKLYPNWRVRRRSVENIIRELEQIIADFPEIRMVNFFDDCFLACPTSYIREFCREFKARVGIGIIAKSTSNYVTEERIRLLKDAGLNWFNMGLQSGSCRMCKEVYRRPTEPSDFVRAAKVIDAARIGAWYDIMLDNPFETVEDSVATALVLSEIPGPFFPQFFSLTFYEGTEIRERALVEHPSAVSDPVRKDYYHLQSQTTNDLIEAASTMPAFITRRLAVAFRKRPEAGSVRLMLAGARYLSRLILRPLGYFRVIRRSQAGSLLRTLSILPVYFRVGFRVYLGFFRGSSRKED